MRALGFALCGFLACAALTTAPAFGQASKGGSILPGGNSREPINIDADKLDYFDKEQKLVYSGNVIAVQGDSRLNASVLTIYLEGKLGGAEKSQAPAAGGSSRMRRMEGVGPITITSKDQVGTGDKLVYEKAANKVYLIGNVTLTQGQNVTKGDNMAYDLTTGQGAVTSNGRVRSLLIQGGPPPAGPAPQREKPSH